MKKVVVFLTVIFLSSTAVANASTNQALADLVVEQGERELRDGDTSDAIHEFSKALMIDPDNKKARWYLSRMHVDTPIYSGVRTPADQMGEMARNIRHTEVALSDLEQERYYLQERVDLLEDAIERKGDHRLLKDIEDYYREAAFYNIDPNLSYDKQLAALHRKHREFKEYTYDRDRVQDKTILVMHQLIGYKEKHLEDAKDDFVRHRLALARNNRELLDKTTRLKKLQEAYHLYLQKDELNTQKLRRMEQDLSETKAQVDMLTREHKAHLNSLKEQVETLEEKQESLEKQEDLKQL